MSDFIDKATNTMKLKHSNNDFMLNMAMERMLKSIGLKLVDAPVDGYPVNESALNYLISKHGIVATRDEDLCKSFRYVE
jgi:hypothetical protein